MTIQWVATLLVVRLLTPTDYGLVAMAMAYIGLVQMFSEFGLGAAVVQRRSLDESQIARLAGVSLIASVILAVISVGASGVVSAYFQEPRVRLIVIVLSCNFIFTGLDIVSRAMLSRDLQFKESAWIQAGQNITYAISSLVMAAFGFGYWALVLAAISSRFVRMTMALKIKPHRIAWPSDLASIKSELWFGTHVVAARFALYVRRFADILVVGRVLGTEALGAYNVGWTQANIPVDRVAPIINRVASSVLAAAQADRAELRRYLRIFTEGLAFMAFPATIGMAVVGDDFVMLVFGERWEATIWPLRILCGVAAVRAITPVLSQVLVATDQTKKNMQFAVAGAILIPGFLLIGTRWGITGVALGWLVGHPLAMGFVLLRHALRTAEMTLTEYIGVLRGPIVSCVTMVAAVVGCRFLMPETWPLVTQFSVEVGVGVVVYGLAVLLLYRERIRSFIRLLRSKASQGSRGLSGDDDELREGT